MRMVSERELKGKKIVGFDPGRYEVNNGHFVEVMHEPRIHLDDGTQLYFVTEEHPDGAEYGVFVGRTKKRK